MVALFVSITGGFHQSEVKPVEDINQYPVLSVENNAAPIEVVATSSTSVHNSDSAPIVATSAPTRIERKPVAVATKSSLVPSSSKVTGTTAPAVKYFDRIHFTLHSDKFEFGFMTKNGAYSGYTATGVEYGVPGVNFETYGSVRWLSVPGDLA